MTNETTALSLARAFRGVDRTVRWGTNGAEDELAELKGTIGDEVGALREKHAGEYLKEKTAVEQPLEEKRREVAINRLTTAAVLAVQQGLGELGEHLDLRAEFAAARPTIADEIGKVLTGYAKVRVPVVKASIQASLEADVQVAEGKVDEIVEKFAPIVTALLAFAKQPSIRSKEVFTAAAEQIFEASKEELLTDEVRSSLKITAPDEEQANEKAKPILIAKIQQRLEALAGK